MKTKKLNKWKKCYSEKKPTKLSWPMIATSDKKKIYSKRKKTHKITMAPWVPNLILSCHALYITKSGFFWITSKNSSPWDSGTDRETGGD